MLGQRFEGVNATTRPLGPRKTPLRREHHGLPCGGTSRAGQRRAESGEGIFTTKPVIYRSLARQVDVEISKV